jgi:putative membrane protein
MYNNLLTKLFICVLVFWGSTVLAADKSEPKKAESKLSRADDKFVREAAEGGMMEVELGKLAAEKANNDQVKAFGRQMQEDHGKANEELKTIAANKGVAFPKSLQGKQKRTVDRLSKLTGTEFDRQYMRAMVDDHKEDLEKFQREANKGQDADVKQFASTHVPVLKKHLEMAQAAERQVKDNSKTSPRGGLPHPGNLKTATYNSNSLADKTLLSFCSTFCVLPGRV